MYMYCVVIRIIIIICTHYTLRYCSCVLSLLFVCSNTCTLIHKRFFQLWICVYELQKLCMKNFKSLDVWTSNANYDKVTWLRKESIKMPKTFKHMNQMVLYWNYRKNSQSTSLHHSPNLKQRNSWNSTSSFCWFSPETTHKINQWDQEIATFSQLEHLMMAAI